MLRDFIRFPRLSVSLAMTASWYTLIPIIPMCLERASLRKLMKVIIGLVFFNVQYMGCVAGAWQCVSGICGGDSHT